MDDDVSVMVCVGVTLGSGTVCVGNDSFTLVAVVVSSLDSVDSGVVTQCRVSAILCNATVVGSPASREVTVVDGGFFNILIILLADCHHLFLELVF